MIVCSMCGSAVSSISAACPRCTGKGIEQPSPLSAILSPTQYSGSPDRWAKRQELASFLAESSYTTTQSTSRAFALPGNEFRIEAAARPQSSPSSSTFRIPFDVHQGPESSNELARVYGSLLDRQVAHPICVSCHLDLKPGSKLYLAKATRESNVCKDDILCRKCFGDMFSLGQCRSCKKPVLGDRDEGHFGAHVKGRLDDIWHASCFRCYHCDGLVYRREHLLTPSGDPACALCFNLPDVEPESRESRDFVRYHLPSRSDSFLQGVALTSRAEQSSSSQFSSLVARFQTDAAGDSTSEVGRVGRSETHPVVTLNSRLEILPRPSRAGKWPIGGSTDVNDTRFSRAHEAKTHSIESMRTIIGSSDKIADPRSSGTSQISLPVGPRGDGESDWRNNFKSDGQQASASQSTFSTIGGMLTCPGCCQKIALMEFGTVSGPRSTRWHRKCLRCGRGSRSNNKGCDKYVDEAAGMDDMGRVLCRSCFLDTQSITISS